MSGLEPGLTMAGVIPFGKVGQLGKISFKQLNKVTKINKISKVGNVSKGEKYAFGLKDAVPDFAEKIGAKHLMKDPDWQTSFRNIINNPKNELHFLLDGIDQTPMNMINFPTRSGINWEIHQLYQSPSFEKTVFYFGGNTFKGFKVFQIKP